MDLRADWTAASEQALLVRFAPDAARATARAAVLHLYHSVQRAQVPGVRNLHPAYSSLMIAFDARIWRAEALIDALQQRIDSLPEDTDAEAAQTRLVDIPVCFDAAFAQDLEALTAHTGWSREMVIERFTAAPYQVSFLGFTPGFPYLEGLPNELAMPRHAAPRPRVEAGSVAIAGQQAGIYPAASPGGWQIIGRTPLRLFDPRREPMSYLETGDGVRFVPISSREFEALSKP